MIKVAVLDDYQRVALRMADWSALAGRAEVQVFDRNLAVPDEAAAALADYEVVCLMRERMAFPRALFERLPDLRLIVLTGMRSPSLDLGAAADRGVLVCHTRGGGTEHSTTELAWGLVLACARRIAREDRVMHEGGWQSTIGTMLHGKTLGLLGLGRLGGRMAALGQAFGMEVIAWSENLTPSRAAEAGAERVEKEELFRRSDVVSIHLVLGERTRGLVGAGEIGLMKPSAFLVNTSRGPIVDETALVEALRTGRIAGAGLDVYDREPLPPDHPLRHLDNTVLTPHLGYVTEETYRVFFADMVEDIAAYLDGRPIRVLTSPGAPR